MHLFLNVQTHAAKQELYLNNSLKWSKSGLDLLYYMTKNLTIYQYYLFVFISECFGHIPDRSLEMMSYKIQLQLHELNDLT